MKPIKRVLLAAAVSVVAAVGAHAAPLEINRFLALCVTDDTANPTRDKLAVPAGCTGTLANIPVLLDETNSMLFGQPHTDVHTGVILVHGSGANPKQMYDSIQGHINAGEKTKFWVVAPQFLYEGQRKSLTDVLRWDKSEAYGYGSGHPTVKPDGVQVSSFDFVDHLVARMKADAPNMTKVVVIGFSRGGRLVNSYSLSTRIDGPASGMTFRYIVSSPSAYTYLDSKRYRTEAGVPKRRGIALLCNERPPTDDYYYNDYPYGLEGLDPNHYVGAPLAEPDLLTTVSAKSRLFLVGEDDIEDPEAGETNQAEICPNKMEGVERHDRALLYQHHLRTMGVTAHSCFCDVPDTDHDGGAIMATNTVKVFMRRGKQQCDGAPVETVCTTPPLP